MIKKLIKKIKLSKEEKFKSFISDDIDLFDLLFLLPKKDDKIYYVEPVVVDAPKIPAPEDEPDFEGTYLGEIELRMHETNLSDAEKISYNSQYDLNKKIVEYLKKFNIGEYTDTKNSSLYYLVDIADKAFYDQFCKGETSNIICSEAFLNRHKGIPASYKDKLIIRDYLPDNQMLCIYHNERNNADMNAAAYIDEKEKNLYIKSVNRYAYLVQD